MIKLKDKPTITDWHLYANPESKEALSIVGWRNRYGTPDTFCDYITLTVEGDNEWDFRVYEATTKPGVSYLLHPMNPKGTAILVPGFYKDAFTIGFHKGKEALIQASPLPVYRDNNGDSFFDERTSSIETGMFGIDVHRAGIFSLIVGNWSAGCQVFKKEADFKEFLGLLKETEQMFFSYNLVEFT